MPQLFSHPSHCLSALFSRTSVENSRTCWWCAGPSSWRLLLKLGFIFVSSQPLPSYPAPQPSHSISIVLGENWNEIKMWATDGDNQWAKRRREREKGNETEMKERTWKQYVDSKYRSLLNCFTPLLKSNKMSEKPLWGAFYTALCKCITFTTKRPCINCVCEKLP